MRGRIPIAMPLEISSLNLAVQRLAEGLIRYELDREDIQIRDGLVQRFEFTYELSCKLLRRYLEMPSANPVEIDALTFQDLIRTANEQGLLLGEWLDWKQYRDMRARTSHTYYEVMAIEVVNGIPKFLDEAKTLRDRLALRILID